MKLFIFVFLLLAAIVKRLRTIEDNKPLKPIGFYVETCPYGEYVTDD